jgi:uncharacterized membrane protein YbaN (DUF454 family)
MFGRSLYLALGWVSVGLGVLGIIMPLFPTTPFLLVALWAFSRSSPELAERLRNNPRVGPLIRNWQDAGVVPPKAKVLAIVMVAAMMSYVILRGGLSVWAVAAVGAVMAGIVAYIITRPSHLPEA